MRIDLFSGMEQDKIFNILGGTNRIESDKKLQEDIKILLTQEKGKFYPDPDFGSDLNKLLFEPMTSILGRQIQTEIKDIITRYYPQLNLVGIDVNMLQESKKIEVSINYSYTDSYQDISTINLTLFNKIEV